MDVLRGPQHVAVVRVALLEAMLVGARQVQRVTRSDDAPRATSLTLYLVGGSKSTSKDAVLPSILAYLPEEPPNIQDRYINSSNAANFSARTFTPGVKGHGQFLAFERLTAAWRPLQTPLPSQNRIRRDSADHDPYQNPPEQSAW
jgi:hypothetical protein